ncbi:MAG: PIG-L deacetylase family protein [Candidatus Promineifilaceae bacterium]
MQSEYDSIYLSPHLDDVALSCAGQVFMKSGADQNVLVVTVMAGDPPGSTSEFARSLHGRWQLERDVVASRRKEDEEAMRILGADLMHWPIPDCIYRSEPTTGAALYNSNEAIFGTVSELERPLIIQIAERIRQLPPHGRLFTSLGVGNHVDHQITRLAAEMVSPHVAYYEEYPYVIIPGALQRVVDAEDSTLVEEKLSLTDEAVQKRIEAIAAYRSQVSSFFRDRADLEQAIENYCRETGGERVWHRAKP